MCILALWKTFLYTTKAKKGVFMYLNIRRNKKEKEILSKNGFESG